MQRLALTLSVVLGCGSVMWSCGSDDDGDANAVGGEAGEAASGRASTGGAASGGRAGASGGTSSGGRANASGGSSQGGEGGAGGDPAPGQAGADTGMAGAAPEPAGGASGAGGAGSVTGGAPDSGGASASAGASGDTGSAGVAGSGGAGVCSGSATPCSEFGAAACSKVDGCAIEQGCSGIPDDCDTREDEESCGEVPGCAWQDGACAGTAGVCADLPTRRNCVLAGCVWNACSGDVPDCASLAAIECAAQPGCSLN